MKKDRLEEKKQELLSKCTKCGHTGFLRIKGEKHDCECMQKWCFIVKIFYAGIDPEYWDLEFEHWKGDSGITRHIDKYIKNLDNVIREGLSLGLGGNFGVGKTFVITLILKAAFRKGYTGKFITLVELLNKIKSSFDKRDEEKAKLIDELQDITECDILGLDDLGKEYLPADFGKFTAAECDRLFRFRRRNLLPTVITTNLEKNEFIERYGSSLKSILSSRFKFLKVLGDDFRSKQGKEWDKLVIKKHKQNSIEELKETNIDNEEEEW